VNMKNIKVLGTGCRNCETTAKLIAEVAAAKGVGIELEKVTDMAAILGYGVMSTPGVVMDGKVVHAGGVPDRKKIEIWLRFPGLLHRHIRFGHQQAAGLLSDGAHHRRGDLHTAGGHAAQGLPQLLVAHAPAAGAALTGAGALTRRGGGCNGLARLCRSAGWAGSRIRHDQKTRAGGGLRRTEAEEAGKGQGAAGG
jgi:small redox-active disulfide protein 2